jgi:hypothetical protein
VTFTGNRGNLTPFNGSKDDHQEQINAQRLYAQHHRINFYLKKKSVNTIAAGLLYQLSVGLVSPFWADMQW